MNDVMLYKENNGISISDVDKVSDILCYNKSLNKKDVDSILKAYNSGLYDMTAEYVWSKTIGVLRKKILNFGEGFLLELLDRPITMSINDISQNEIISLSSDLGFINKTAKIEFLQFSEVIRHYLSNDNDDILPKTKLNDIIRACFQYVLGFEDTYYVTNFSDFRDKLKSEYIKDDEEFYLTLLNSPYFYKRTVYKTLINLTKNNANSSEREIVLNNIILIFSGMWTSLSSEDKLNIGKLYTQSVADGDKELVRSLKSVLLTVKGFDFVPENLRSEAYVLAAKNLLDAHLGYNNFYNEPQYARTLLQMGNSIPSPAFGKCIEVVIACKIGNKYGVSIEAQDTLDTIIKNVSKARWEYFFNEVVPNSDTILFKFCENETFLRWVEFCNNINFEKMDLFLEPEAKELIKYTFNKEFSKIKQKAEMLLKEK